MTAGHRHTSEDGVVTRREDPQVVVVSLPGSYTPTVIDLRAWPCAMQLRVQFADAIEALTGVNGTWKTAASARGKCYSIRAFANWCSENHVSELEQLTPDRWNSYVLHVADTAAKPKSQSNRLGLVRRALLQFPDRLHRDLPKHLNRRLPKSDSVECQPFSDEIYDKILKAARAAVNAEYDRIRPNLTMLERRGGGNLADGSRDRANALFEIATTGAPQSDKTRTALGIPVSNRANYSGVSAARPLLFVSLEGAVAIAVLIACLEGVNFAPINERKVPSAAPGIGVQEDIRTVEDEKRRRQSQVYDAHAIPRNARRAMAKIIEMTQPGRDYLAANNLPGADRLIVYWPGKTPSAAPSVGLSPGEVSRSRRISWWPDRDIPISFNRIRKTVRVAIDRSPQGHSRATWSTIYVGSSDDERERLMTEAVETGLWSVIENARNHLRMRFERAPAVTDASSASKDDTVIGSCIDWEHHPVTGAPCGDDFLLCLQCTNAFATPRHLPRLIELRHQLEGIASTDGPDWTDFRAMAYACLLALIEDRTLITADEYLGAERAITEDDRAEIHLLLNGRYV